MPRYIDANALWKLMSTYDDYQGATGNHNTDMIHRDSILFAIEQAPTVSPDEVRGVVHCGECRFWRRPPSCEGLARCETGETGIRYRSKNDFCSRGAKMEVTDDA